MSYRCQVCLKVSAPRRAVLKHTVYRQRQTILRRPKPEMEIEREVAVCQECYRDLSSMSLTDLMVSHALTRVRRLEQERLRRATRRATKRAALRQAQAPLQRRQPSIPPAPSTQPEPVQTQDMFPPSGVAPKRRALTV